VVSYPFPPKYRDNRWVPPEDDTPFLPRSKVQKIPDGISFRADVAGTALALQPGQDLTNGTAAGAGWQPRTVFLTAGASAGRVGFLPDLDPITGQPNPAPTGTVNVEIRGLLEGAGYYVRRFGVTVERMVQLDIATLRDVWIRVISASVPNASLLGVVTCREATRGAQQPLFFAESYATAALWRVPPGAVALLPDTTDAGFSWSQTGAGGVVQLIPQAAAIGVRQQVGAITFRNTATPFRAIWEILP